MKDLVRFFLILTFTILSGCAGKPLESMSETKGKSGILINYTIKAADNIVQAGGCQLVLSGPEGDAFLPLDPKKTYSLVFAPPGKYVGKKLFCGASRQWDLDSLYRYPFQVWVGKVSYLGRVNLRFEITNTNRDVVIELDKREDTQSTLAQVFEKNSVSIEDNLVSAFNGKKIDKEMAFLPIKRLFIRELQTAFNECDKVEIKKNPAVIGALSYQVKYKNNSFFRLSPIVSTHTFSDDYVACVEKALRDFQPGIEKETTYQVSF